MTLIAGFYSDGRPALVGDFMISRNGQPTDRRKKLIRVRKNFAVAWTGSLLAASHVVRSLQESVKRPITSLEEVREVLTDSSLLQGLTLDVILIGWVVDSTGSSCFRWRSDYPGELFLSSYHSDGSGSTLIDTIFAPLSNRVFGDGEYREWNVCKTIQGVLNVTTQLMKLEMVGPSTSAFGFGYGYEGLVWNDSESSFVYVDDVLYYSAVLDFTDDGKMTGGKMVGPIYKIRAHGEITSLFGWFREKRAFAIETMRPVGRQDSASARELKNRLVEEAKAVLPYASSWYCAFWHMRSPNFHFPPVASAIQHGPDNLVDVSRSNEIWFNLRSDHMEMMFNAIRRAEEQRRR